jgi:hypothetical protein
MGLKEMKSVEKKLMEIEDRVSRLRELSSDIASFEDYQASRNYREMVERKLQDNYLQKKGSD